MLWSWSFLWLSFLYRLFKKTAPDQLGFLITRCGPATLMFAAEQLEIRCHNPPANSTQTKKVKCNHAGRARPPRSCRDYTAHCVREGAFQGQIAGSQLQAAKFRVIRAQLFNLHHARQQDDVRALQLSFTSAYRLTQLQWFATTGLCGPLNICSRRHWRLALLFLSTPGGALHWRSVDKQWRYPCAALLLWRRARAWLGHRRRLAVQQQVYNVLHSRSLPPTKSLTILLPRRCFLPAAKSAVHTAVLQHPHWNPSLQQYVLRSTRVVIGREPTFADKQNCGTESQTVDWTTLAECDDNALAEAISGKGGIRVECNWKMPVRPNKQSDVAALTRSMFGWAKQFAWPGTAKKICGQAVSHLRSTHAWKQSRQSWDSQKSDYMNAVSKFHRAKHEIICPDDKVKQYKWRLPLQSYFLMMAWFVCVSDTWKVSVLTAEEANAWRTLVLLTFAPRALHKQFGLSRGKWFLPCCYSSLKTNAIKEAAARA